MNIYNFTGRLGRDSETRTTQGGIAICSFTVAVDYGYGENKGTNWLRCSMFGKRAEGQLPKYLVKGTQVAISGELRIREYDDREGARRTSTEVSVDKLDLIGGRNDNQGQAPQGQQPQQPQQPQQQGGFPTHGGQPTQQPQAPYNPNAQGMPVDDEIPF